MEIYKNVDQKSSQTQNRQMLTKPRLKAIHSQPNNKNMHPINKINQFINVKEPINNL